MNSRSALAMAAAGAVGMWCASAAGQWWWPPDMQVQPPCPSPSSNIVVTLSGDWPDSCVPNTAQRTIVGQTIDITTGWSVPPGFCLTVITPWSLQVPIGTLGAGTYEVYGVHMGVQGPTTQRELLGEIIVSTSCPGGCYPNCDGSTTEPVLNVADFGCFLQKFAAGDAYANCDGSTTEPILNVADFGCFLQKFAAGCN